MSSLGGPTDAGGMKLARLATGRQHHVPLRDHTPMSKLAQFIRGNVEQILSEWETFARTLRTADAMDVVTLRDHAREMLVVVACELEAPPTPADDAEVGRKGVPRQRRRPTAAQEHGAGRADIGFTVGQMVSEFRALRSSVVRLWTRQLRSADATDLTELTRFHEAIDRLIAESATRFSEQIKESKERFLAILGHDLRSPLGAITTSSAFLLETGDLRDPQLTLVRSIANSADRMNQMVTDLLDFARTRFGDRIPIEREELDMRDVVEEVVAEVSASSPGRKVEVETSGDLRGKWDANRLAQVLANLVGNAVQHGAPGAPITVTARGGERDVTVSVHSEGPTIPKRELRQLFKAMKNPEPDATRDRRHLGLGLYIVDKIVAAHDGSVDVRSSTGEGTTFIVRLPKDA